MPDLVRQTFASNLRAEFDAHGLTQDDFCATYNKRYEPQIQRTSVSRWLSCTQFPHTNVLENIADYFNRDVAWFFEIHQTSTERNTMPDLIRQTFGNNLRSEINRLHLTQEEFTNKYNATYPNSITRAAVSHWETGVRYPRPDILTNIADFFGRKESWFFDAEHLNSEHQKAIDTLKALDNSKLPAVFRFLEYASQATKPIDLDRLEAALKLL